MREGTVGGFVCGGNRFKLVVLASQRAHEISSGACVVTPGKGDKSTVTALKEMASGQLDSAALLHLAVRRCKKYLEGFTGPYETARREGGVFRGRGYGARGESVSGGFDDVGSVFLNREEFFPKNKSEGSA